MTLDNNKLYIKIIALHTTYNYIVYKFFYLELFRVPKYFLSEVLKFYFKTFQKTLDVDMVYIKVCHYNLELCS